MGIGLRSVAAAVAAVALGGAPLALAPASASPTNPAPVLTNVSPVPSCSGDPTKPFAMDYEVDGQASYAGVALPAGPPKGLIVYAHAYTHWPNLAGSGAGELTAIAEKTDAIVVEPDYRGTTDPTEADGASRGAPIHAGAQDVVAVGRWFADHCATPTDVLLSFSMGSGVAGLALESAPKRGDGRPLFNLWASGSGAYDEFEDRLSDYLGSLATGTTSDELADYEVETGGTPLAKPGAYIALSAVYFADAIAHSGLAATVLVHAAADEVSIDQPIRLAAGMAAAGATVRLIIATTIEDQAEEARLCPGGPRPVYGGATAINELPDLGNVAVPLAGHVGDPTYCRAIDIAADWINGHRLPTGLSAQVAEDRFLDGVVPPG